MKPYLLLVADQTELQAQVRTGLAAGYEIAASTDRLSALAAFRATRPLCVVLDLGLAGSAGPPNEALGAIADVLVIDPHMQIVVLYGPGEREAARAAALSGATDFVRKPLELDELKLVLRRCVHLTRLERELREARLRAPHEVSEGLVGACPTMVQLFETVRKVATADAPVLISGEPGTGKESLARAIHQRSLRANGPFVAASCSAIPEALIDAELFGTARTPGGAGVARKGRIELAQGGTIFLDDLEALSLPLQLQVLRLLQEQTIERVGYRHPLSVDCRVIAASPAPLDEAVAAGRFRRDLYYRLAVVHLQLPPLRERGEDVLLLAQSFLHRFSTFNGRAKPSLSPDAAQALRDHAWPGNVRELQSRIRRGLIMADGHEISAFDLGLRAAEEAIIVSNGPLRVVRENVEREVVRRALAHHDGKISGAAAELQISRPTLYELMQKLGLRRPTSPALTATNPP